MKARRARETAKKTKEAETIGREFGHTLSWSAARSSKLTYAEAIRDLRSIENEYVQRLAAYPEFALEARRRIAERALEQTLIHGCAQPQCRRKLAFSEELGWSTIDRKLHFHLIYARGMVARGHYPTAIAIAKRFIAHINRELERIERLPKRLDRQYILDWRTFFNEIINETKRAAVKGYSSRWDAGGSFIRDHSQSDNRTSKG
jgi:hypothetical protein